MANLSLNEIKTILKAELEKYVLESNEDMLKINPYSKKEVEEEIEFTKTLKNLYRLGLESGDEKLNRIIDKRLEMIFEKNLFIEAVLPGSILRKLSDAEMNEYRRPFNDKKSRRPTLDWPRQIPLENDPPEICRIVDSYSHWMAENNIPKLFINAEPGAILIGKQREFCRTWKNQKEVTVKGSHFIQEDSPNEIGNAIFDWLKGID